MTPLVSKSPGRKLLAHTLPPINTGAAFKVLHVRCNQIPPSLWVLIVAHACKMSFPAYQT